MTSTGHAFYGQECNFTPLFLADVSSRLFLLRNASAAKNIAEINSKLTASGFRVVDVAFSEVVVVSEVSIDVEGFFNKSSLTVSASFDAVASRSLIPSE